MTVRRPIRRAGRAALAAALVAVLAAPLALAAEGDEAYYPLESGHPVRVAAYALHPVGVILDWLIFRPAWWLGQHEPLRTLFGRETHQAALDPALPPNGG